MAGIKRLSAPPEIMPDDEGVSVKFVSGDKTAQFSMSWHHFTLALHEAQKLYAEGEAARRGRVVEFAPGAH